MYIIIIIIISLDNYIYMYYRYIIFFLKIIVRIILKYMCCT